MISLRYSLSTEDLVKYNLYVQIEAPGKSKARWKRLLPILIIMGVIFCINMFSDVASGYLNIFSFLPILFVMALFIFMNIFVYKQNVKKAAINYAANPENSSYFNMTDYTFSETGVTIKDDVKESKLQWKAFVKKQENAAYIYLFVTASSAYVIPKRIFKSEVQQEELNRLFGQYLSFDAEVGHLVKD